MTEQSRAEQSLGVWRQIGAADHQQMMMTVGCLACLKWGSVLEERGALLVPNAHLPESSCRNDDLMIEHNTAFIMS